MTLFWICESVGRSWPLVSSKPSISAVHCSSLFLRHALSLITLSLLSPRRRQAVAFSHRRCSFPSLCQCSPALSYDQTLICLGNPWMLFDPAYVDYDFLDFDLLIHSISSGTRAGCIFQRAALCCCFQCG